MKRYYDSINNRLVYCKQTASPDFWDSHWRSEVFNNFIRIRNPFVTKFTRRYLPEGSKILEGGCGRGQNVYTLRKIGYCAYGVDFAPETVALVNQYAPELDVQIGDVRSLPFEDGYFDGYWSMGVIEHFFQGYDTILSEMARVVREDGYLFLTFPRMSFLRKIKARIGHYQIVPRGFDPEVHHFYQFALRAENVIDDINRLGFELITKTGFDGLKGLKDEIKPLKRSLQKIYDNSNILTRLIKIIVEPFLSPLSGHCALLVLRKNP